MNSRLLLFSFVLLAGTMHSCRKHDEAVVMPVLPPATPTSIAVPDLPTEDLDGRYLWHGTILRYVGGGFIYEEGVKTDGIKVLNDTTLVMSSDEENVTEHSVPVYKYVSSSDSEIVYCCSSTTITYKFRRNLVVWTDGKWVLYGVTGQTTKWASLYDANITSTRSWHRQKRYYPDYTSFSDTLVTLPDTTGSAFLLFMSVSGLDRASLFLAGADSTCVIYQSLYYDHRDNSRYIAGVVNYYAKGDSVNFYYDEHRMFGSAFSFQSQ